MAVLESDEGEEPQTFRAEILSNGRRNKATQPNQVSNLIIIQRAEREKSESEGKWMRERERILFSYLKEQNKNNSLFEKRKAW